MKRLSLLILIILISVNLKAQIEYFDVLDTTINNISYSIDIDNDNNVDYLINYFFEVGAPGTGETTEGYTVIPYNDNAVLTNGYNGIVSKNENETICEFDIDWMSNPPPGPSFWVTREVSYDSSFNIRANGFDDIFIGIRLKIDGNYHYGWIQISSTESSNLTIKSWAYNTIPNDCIEISEGLIYSQVSFDISDSYSIYPNPANSFLIVKSDFNRQSNVELFDVNGKRIFESQFYREILIPVENYLSGFYTLRILNKSDIITRRIIIE